MLARTHAAMGNPDLALPILTGLRTMSQDDVTQREAVHLSGELYFQKKRACPRHCCLARRNRVEFR